MHSRQHFILCTCSHLPLHPGTTSFCYQFCSTGIVR